MCVQCALQIRDIADYTDFLPWLYVITLPDFYRAVQAAVPTDYAIVVINGNGVPPQGILAYLFYRSGIYGKDICSGFTAQINTVVGLPCTGCFGFYQFAAAERV